MNYPIPGLTVPVKAAVCDDKWINNEYMESVAKRGAAIISMREKSSAASAASAACDHIHDWSLGTTPG
jgi:malate dehydrogenase